MEDILGDEGGICTRHFLVRNSAAEGNIRKSLGEIVKKVHKVNGVVPFRLRYGLAPPDNVRADLGVGWVYICIKARVAIPNPNHVRGVTVIQHKIFKVRPKLGLLFTVSFKGIHCTGSVYINDRNGVRESGNSKVTYAGGMWLKVSDMRPKGGRNEEAHAMMFGGA